jgi:hypothetical protein
MFSSDEQAICLIQSGRAREALSVTERLISILADETDPSDQVFIGESLLAAGSHLAHGMSWRDRPRLPSRQRVGPSVAAGSCNPDL